MYDRMQSFSEEELTMIHTSSMAILKQTGVVFNNRDALQLFRENGFKVDEKTVFFAEKDVLKALETAPSSFELHARNPAKNVLIGKMIKDVMRTELLNGIFNMKASLKTKGDTYEIKLFNR